MSDKLLLGLSELTPAFLASYGLMEQPKDIDYNESTTDTLVKGGLIGLLRKEMTKEAPNKKMLPAKEFYKALKQQEAIAGGRQARRVGPDQIIDLRDQDEEYDDVIDDFDSEEELVPQVQVNQDVQVEQQIQAGNPDDDPPDRRDFGQNVDHGVPNPIRLIEAINQMDMDSISKALIAVNAILARWKYKVKTDDEGNWMPEPHSEEEQQQLEQYEKESHPLKEGCRRFLYFEDNVLKEMKVCRGKDIKIKTALKK